MITTRFSQKVADDIAKGVDTLIDGKFRALIKELVEYKALFARIVEQEKIIDEKSNEVAKINSLLEGYDQGFDSILDSITKIYDAYVNSDAKADVELMLGNELPPEDKKKQIRQQVRIYLFNYFKERLEKSSSNQDEIIIKADRLVEEILKIDPDKKDQVDKFLRKRRNTFGLKEEDYIFLIGLESKIDQEKLTMIVHHNAGIFFTGLINFAGFTTFNEMLEELKTVDLDDLACYQLYFLTECMQKIVPFFDVLTANPSYAELFQQKNELEFDIRMLRLALQPLIDNTLAPRLANQPQTIIINAFNEILLEAIELYQKEARILIKSLNNSWRAALALVEALKDDRLHDLDKINLIIEFLQRQPEKHGLEHNSFDTFFLSVLYKKNCEKPFFNNNPLYPHNSLEPALPAPGIEIPPLLRGEQHLRKNTDRASIRNSTRLLLFKLKPVLQICMEETQRYLRLHPTNHN